MIKRLLLQYALLICLILFGKDSSGQQLHYTKANDGIIIHFNNENNSTHLLRLQVINDDIIHVTATPADSFSSTPSLMVVDQKLPRAKWDVEQNNNQLVLSTADINAIVLLNNAQIFFVNAAGDTILKEKPGRYFTPVTIDGEKDYRIRQEFIAIKNEALYGLGENQLGLTNLRGKDIELAQHNSEAFIPFFVSTKNYGILWDNNSITHFGDPSPYLPLSALHLFDKNNIPGALTATYTSSINGIMDPITREENNINYPVLSSLKNVPDNFSMANNAEVKWEGYISSDYSGVHSFLLNSGGYIKMWIDGKLLVNKWRQCWNPASTLIEYPMQKNKEYPIKISWKPDGQESFLTLKWKKPLTDEEKNIISLASEMGDDINYYFIDGNNMDDVISGYRTLTGKAPIMPVWAYGFWQSREHYDSQKEILNIVNEFRSRHIPLDNIVQDWFYWKKDQWGSQQFDLSRYPDPKGMIDSLHDEHTHFMISVWPKFYVKANTFDEFWNKGWLYKKNVLDQQKDWVGYVSTFYDAFNKDARKALWNLVDNRLFNLGVDAWWLDATEPDILSNTSIAEKKQLMNPTALGSSTKYFNAFPLENSKAFYNGQREAKPNQRVFILTRSSFAGNQRYAAATWSGDIGATWQDMKNQIATGISFSISGIPYWTMDIGGFATESRYQHPDKKNLEEWREQMTRWYQFGAFCPLFRAHGQAPYREIFNVAPEDNPAYQSILYYDKLRYRLMPYIYSLAGKTYWDNYTIMRGLVMDFEADTIARNITDEYMFGPSLLINPVYEYKARTRKVYLPANSNWYNLYNGKFYSGGKYITADASYSRMPIFVKAGSIIPFGPAMEYTQQKPADTITLFVYTGANGSFNLYEDDGLSYDYEKGKYSIIPMQYDDQTKTLTIKKREGTFNGMLQKRIFNIKWISPEHVAALDFSQPADKVIHYDGKEITAVNGQWAMDNGQWSMKSERHCETQLSFM